MHKADYCKTVSHLCNNNIHKRRTDFKFSEHIEANLRISAGRKLLEN